MKTAVIYTRVSSREQAEEGFSIEAQVKACQKKAREDGFKVVKVFRDEGFTGTSSDRPALNELLNHCRHNSVHAVIIHKLDRFARSIVDHSALRAILQKYGTNLVSVTEQLGTAPHEIFLENIMASMAQYYSDNLKTEVKKGKIERFESGYHMATAPFGYIVTPSSKIMQIVPEEATLIRKMFSLYITGHYSFESIAKKLFKLGFKSRQGKAFTKGRIQKMLTNEIYEGIVEYKQISKKTKGLHEPIISTTVFNLAQEIMNERGNIKLKEKGKFDFLFKGFVSCSECGKPLYAAYSTGGSGIKHLYYCCRNKAHKSINIKEADVYSAFNETIEPLHFADGGMVLVSDYVKDNLEMKAKEALGNVRRSEKILNDIDKERVALFKEKRAEKISQETFKAMESEIEDRETVAKASLNEDKIDYYDLITQLRMFYNFGTSVSRYWEIASFDQRKEILCSMFTNAPKFENGKLTNVEISPLYKAFGDFAEALVSSNRGDMT